MSKKDSLLHLSNSEIDQLFKIESYALESADYDSKTFYTDGLTSADALYTDYQDLLQIHTLLMELGVKSFCDLGAGIGRAKLLFDYLESPFQSYSVEFVRERHMEGVKAHKYLNLNFLEGFQLTNLLDDAPPVCDAYFIYLPVNEVLEKTMCRIEELFQDKSCYLFVIESHGDLLHYIEDTHQHMKLSKKVPLRAKRHHSDLCLYEWSPKSTPPLPKVTQPYFKPQDETTFWTLWKKLKANSFFQIVVREENSVWLADLKDSQFGIQRGTLETAYPPRIIPLSQIEGIIEAPIQWSELIEKRRASERSPLGEIRKLFVFPSPQVEYSWGQKKELDLAWEWETFTTLGV